MYLPLKRQTDYPPHMKVKDVIKLLERMVGIWLGLEVVIGSLSIRTNLERLQYSGKLSVDVPPGTLNSILKQASLR
jgi:predicted RNA binding protein YcfA (HicA-like mRNA interferase family)